MPINANDGTKTVTLTLDPGAGYTVGTTASATATIVGTNSPGFPGVFHQPDQNLAYGLTYLEALTGSGDGQLHVRFALNGSVYSSALPRVYLFLDTDQNPATGNLPAHHVAGPEYRIDVNIISVGANEDYFIDQLPSAVNQPDRQWQPIDIRTPDGQVTYQGSYQGSDYYSLSIPLRLLGTPAPRAVDVFAFLTAGSPGIIAPPGTSQGQTGDGARVPEYGVIDSSTGKVVVRDLVPTRITQVTDTTVGAGGGYYELTSALFAAVADQYEIDLTYSQPITPAAPLIGILNLDADRSLDTGDIPLMGISKGTDIPTWGADTSLYFRIAPDASPLFPLAEYDMHNPLSDPQANFGGVTDYAGTINDGRWVVSGHTLGLRCSLSTLDPVLLTQLTPLQEASSRVPTKGAMYARLDMFNSDAGGLYDSLPNGPTGVVDTATGQVVQPLTVNWGSTPPISSFKKTSPGTGTASDLVEVDAQVVQGNLVVRTVLGQWYDDDILNNYVVYLDSGGTEYLVRVWVQRFYNTYVYQASLQNPDGTVFSHDAWLNHENYSIDLQKHGSFTLTIPLRVLQGVGSQIKLSVDSYQGRYYQESTPPIVVNLNNTGGGGGGGSGSGGGGGGGGGGAGGGGGGGGGGENGSAVMPPPVLVSEQRLFIGKGRKRTLVFQLKFSTALNATVAQNTGHYSVVQVIRAATKKRPAQTRRIPVRAALYNPGNNSVTITLGRYTALNRLSLTATGLIGVTGAPAATIITKL